MGKGKKGVPHFGSAQIAVTHFKIELIPVDSVFSSVPFSDTFFRCFVVHEMHFDVSQNTDWIEPVAVSSKCIRFLVGRIRDKLSEVQIQISLQIRNKFNITGSINEQAHCRGLVGEMQVLVNSTAPTVVGDKGESLLFYYISQEKIFNTMCQLFFYRKDGIYEFAYKEHILIRFSED